MISNLIIAQNYFPLRINDTFQFKTFYEIANWSNIEDWYEYPFENVNDSIIINNNAFVRFMDNYYYYNQIEQKLYTAVSIIPPFMLGFKSALSVDFNLNAGEQDTLTFNGWKNLWISEGTDTSEVFGRQRLTYGMKADFYDNVSNKAYHYKVRFADSLGLFYLFYKVVDQVTFTSYTILEELITCVLSGDTINKFSLNIVSVSDTNDRPINLFPYYLEINYEPSYPEFLDSSFAEYNVYREDTLVKRLIFDPDLIPTKFFIYIISESLEVGDKIKFRIYASDKSIFNNEVFSPSFGLYEFEVLPEVSGIESEQEIEHIYFSIEQNYPNPFNPTTNIGFRIAERRFVSLKVYDVLGNEIATLVNEEKPAGKYEVEFNSHSVEGRNLTSGVYFYQLIAKGPETSSGQEMIRTKKMVYLK